MLSSLADWLLGCSHRRTGFPITRRGERPETYVVCLECGARFPYDWSRMRVAGRPVGAEKSIRARQDGLAQGMASDAPHWWERLVHHT